MKITGVLEVVQVDKEDEPSFEIWLRRNALVPDGQIFELRWFRDPLAPASSVPPPRHWPLPADNRSNLADALAWYLERFVENPVPPVRQRAGYVMNALTDWGRYVFGTLFSTVAARSVYEEVVRTAETDKWHIEIHSDDYRILSWPWEALIDHNDCFLGETLGVERRYIVNVVGKHELGQLDHSHPDLNVLLITARAEFGDVDYRHVGKCLAMASSKGIRVTLLRPATLEHLREAMQTTKHSWDVLHFDCHGWWGPLEGKPAQGYLMLENEMAQLQPVSSDQLLSAFGTHCPRHIVLNACRSASVGDDTELPIASIATSLLKNPTVSDVTAMAFNLHVDASTPFLTGLYFGLASAIPISVAVKIGRDMMRKHSRRTYEGGTIEINDWMVPVVYRRAAGYVTEDLKWGSRILFQVHPALQPFRNDLFVGRDDIIFALERLALKKIPVVLLYGLAGQGKTAILREFVWWRSQTGDDRQAIWIDFEQVQGARDVLWRMAIALPNPPIADIDTEALEGHVARALAENAYWVIWDHLHVWRSDDAAGSAGMSADRNRLSSWLTRLDGNRSVILGASRGPEPWFEDLRGSFQLPVSGLRPIDRWRLALQLLELPKDDPGATPNYTDRVRHIFEGVLHTPEQLFPDTYLPSVSAPSDTFLNSLGALLSCTEGNPLITRDALARVRAGQPPNNILRALRNDISSLPPWRLDTDQAQRLERSLKCLHAEEITPLLPFLALHDRLIDEDLLRRMITRVRADAHLLVDTALKRLDHAGLVFRRSVLHPLLSGSLRDYTQPTISEDICCAFVETIAEFQRASMDRVDAPKITMDTTRRAFHIALEHNWIAPARQLGSDIVQCCCHYNNFPLAREIQNQVARTYDDDYTIDAIRATLTAATVAREAAYFEEAQRWLEDAESRVRRFHDALSYDLQFALLFERGKIAQIRGDLTGYRDSMMRAHAIAETNGDPARDAQIAYELVQTADLPKTSAGAALVAVLNKDRSSHSYRARAQLKMLDGKFEEARVLLQRAIALSKQSDNKIETGINVSIIGELEAATGNLDAAIARFDDATSIFDGLANKHYAGVTYNSWAKLYYDNHLFEQAGTYFIHAARCFYEMGDDDRLATICDNFRALVDLAVEAGKASLIGTWVQAGLPNIAGIESMDKVQDLYQDILSRAIESGHNITGVPVLTPQPAILMQFFSYTPPKAGVHKTDDAQAYDRLGSSLAGHDIPNAEWAFRESLRLKPDNPDSLFKLALLLYNRGNVREAADLLGASIRLSPDKADAHLLMGLVLQHDHRSQEAEDAFRQSLRLKPDNADALLRLAALLGNHGNIREAEALLTDSIRLAPNDAHAHHLMGLVLEHDNRNQEAEEAYRESIRLKPDKAASLLSLAVMLYTRGNVREAEDLLRKAIGVNPENAEAHYYMGLVFEHDNRSQEAEEAYRESIRLDPDNPEKHYVLGMFLETHNRIDEAEEAYRESIRLNPDDPDVQYNLGTLLGKQGRSEAEDFFRHAIRLKPNYAAAYHNLGIHLSTQGRIQESQKAFRQAKRYGTPP